MEIRDSKWICYRAGYWYRDHGGERIEAFRGLSGRWTVAVDGRWAGSYRTFRDVKERY